MCSADIENAKNFAWVGYEEQNFEPESEVPYFLIADKESDPIVKEITKRLEQDLRDCRSQPLQATIHGKIVPISCNIKHTQFVRAVIQKTSGLGGALCTMCPATRHELLYYLFCILCMKLLNSQSFLG